MYNDKFLGELLDNCKEEYSYFVSFQDRVLAAVTVTHKILLKHNINYYAIYGTLLGIYRDHGQIPWDYDFDILISIDDAPTVQRILEDELPDDYYIISNYNNNSFPYYQMRIVPKGFDHRVHLDIYYYFGIPEDNDVFIKMKKTVISLYYNRIRRVTAPYKTKSVKKNMYYRYLWVRNRIKYPFQSVKRMDKKFTKITHSNPIREAKRVSVFCETCDEIDKLDLGMPQIMTCDNREICVPSNTERILSQCYNNYNEYPSLEERIAVFRHGLEQMKDIEKRKANNETKNK